MKNATLRMRFTLICIAHPDEMEGLRLSYLLALVAAVLSVDATGGDAVIKRQAEGMLQ